MVNACARCGHAANDHGGFGCVLIIGHNQQFGGAVYCSCRSFQPIIVADAERCVECGGSGEIEEEDYRECDRCGGTGQEPEQGDRE